jgi:RimJ/RimL family protein N-acetyltransferase
MHELNQPQAAIARPVFQAADIHLAAAAILDGSVQAPVYVDNLRRPQAGLAWNGARLYLAGDPEAPGAAEAAGRCLTQTIIPAAVAGGQEALTIYFAPQAWEPRLEALLEERLPLVDERLYYVLDDLEGAAAVEPPQGFRLRSVDRQLISEAGLAGLDWLLDEMVSERASVEEFLQYSFGVCLLAGEQIVGWCLSEYNSGTRCEVGIATAEAFQRRGLATLMGKALAAQAWRRGLRQVGWHCYASNQPSAATALKIGFRKAADYRAYTLIFDPALNLAVHGNRAFARQEFLAALGWYEKSLANENAPDWAYWNAACASARSGAAGAAFAYLEQAFQKGFSDRARLRTSPHLESLRSQAEWPAWLERIEAHA